MLAWLLKLFGYAAAPLIEREVDDVARIVRDHMKPDEGRSMPLSGADAEYQRAMAARGVQAAKDAQAARAAQAYPPTCPASLPPSAPPPAPMSPEHEPWHQASVDFDHPPVTLTPRPVAPPRPLSRTSSGPPPRMSPPPALPIPAPSSSKPVVPRPPRRR